MAKIHELLALESDKVAAANALVDEGVVTFSKKPDHFLGLIKTVEMYDEQRSAEGTTDVKEIVTSVDDKLDHVWTALIEAIDVTTAKENSNTVPAARADVIIGDKKILENVPATALLALEKKLRRIQDLYNAIPTLDPAYAWIPDTDSAVKGAMTTAHPQEQQKTEKVHDFKVMVPPTDKHPAQVTEFTLDRNVGKIKTIRTSGMVSPATKALWLKRIADLASAVKEARSRANMADVARLPAGAAIREFIHATV